MREEIKGLKVSVNFNISVKADKVFIHDKREYRTFHDEQYEGLDASAGFNVNFDADSYTGELDLKEFGDMLNNMIKKSKKEVHEQIQEQKTVKETEEEEQK
jgi:hypothetical protein